MISDDCGEVQTGEASMLLKTTPTLCHTKKEGENSHSCVTDALLNWVNAGMLL